MPQNRVCVYVLVYPPVELKRFFRTAEKSVHTLTEQSDINRMVGLSPSDKITILRQGDGQGSRLFVEFQVRRKEPVQV